MHKANYSPDGTIDRTPSTDVDVCVVGAGPAGTLVTYVLANKGYDVVILEAGARFDHSSRLARMERMLRPASPAVSAWDMGGARDRFTSSGETQYRLNRKRVKGVGGSTLHWGGRVARFPQKDFEMKTRYGLASDWPISYADLKPYYAAAEREFGVAGAVDNPFSPPRDEPYPMDAFPASHADSIYQTACDKVGIQMHSVPNARNAEQYDGRSACVGYGTCSPVCPSKAQYSADIHAEKAVQSGARIIDRAAVQRLEHDARDRITGAVYETPDGHQYIQRANQFVLAAGGIETPRLLLLSSSDEHPNGLANRSGAVGRYLMESPYVGVDGELDVPTKQHQIGFGTRESYQFYEPDEAPPGSFKIEFYNTAGPTLAELALQQRDPLSHIQDAVRRPTDTAALESIRADTEPIRWGDDLLNYLDEEFGHYFRIGAEVEVLPYPENRVTLDETETDAYGNPVPDISWGKVGEHEKQTVERAYEVIEKIVRNLDATVKRSSRWESWEGAGHPSGTTRMGTDPESSVVDPTLRTHDLKNLYIAGSSVFVTSGASQPTLTIAALALRLGDHLAANVL
ncbi:GMC family oxidoreductase [Salinigranum salinum]|uniref:GMC family oxidoreductase n=1 Tax=Salinigranum salinum TaxID=1364937 RepID=UPI001260C703|nr:GMC family oxidoreductase [Salinigranum salinum]